MDYMVFARKFRPQTFDEVMGQEPITTTLKNAIRQKRIPQSFLFSGPRGVGKTSVARILAKALNCVKGPAEVPCGKCDSCVEIAQSNSMDVLEIDGASNRGIDEIRNLRDNVKFKPTKGTFKLYIIDEVHMLTAEAFNALLKTLEEPPSHVKFIFATTESHKVPLTILSRCQRFNFKRIPAAEIAGKLEEIARKEKIKYEKNALFLVAKASDGALRDAEGLLDQLASFAEEKIREEDVLSMLGLASEEVYFSVLGAIHQKDGGKIFTLVRDMYEGGKDLVQFAKGLLEMFRHLLLFQCAERAEDFIELSEDGVTGLKERKGWFSRGELLLAISLVGNLQGQLRRNLASPKLLVETCLLKLLHLDGLRALSDVPENAGPSHTEAPRKPAFNETKRSETSAAQSKGDEKPSPTSKREVPPAGLKEKSPVGSEVSLEEVEAAWPQVIENVKEKRMSIGIFLSEAEPVETSGNLVTLGFPSEFQFHKETLDKNNNKKLIEEAFEKATGKRLGLRLVVTKSDVATRESPKEAGEDKGQLPDIIVQAMDVFGEAKIVRKD